MADALALPIPGDVPGIIALFGLLCTGLVKESWIREAAMLEVPAAIFENHLYERNFFERELPGLLDDMPDAEARLERVRELCDKIRLCGNETQLEDEVVAPLLRLLDWPLLRRQRLVVQGKQMEPDWTLFASPEALDAFLHAEESARDTSGVVCFVESKAQDKLLDTGKADRRRNPYFQLLEYLNYARLPVGFLSNGHEWWLVDNRQISARKRYVRVHLDRLAACGSAADYKLFHHLFCRASHVPEQKEQPTVYQCLADADTQRRQASENDLRKVIYGVDGRESLFEETGGALYAVCDRKGPEALPEVFANALYLTFRLLFIAYFEDRHWALLQTHSNYPRLSLRALYDSLQRDAPEAFTGWDALQTLFATLNRGNANYAIPLLNGGLFDNARAPLLDKPRVMDNHTLRAVLDKLFINSEAQGARRDFQSLSVTHLGTIYEGLLGFEFRLAEEELVYLEYRRAGKGGPEHLDGYFDVYDAAAIRADAACRVLASHSLGKGQLYLVGSKNSRKVTASYYTPGALSLPLVRRAVDHALAHLRPGKSLLDLRILDNACGSGHLLVESLGYLTQRALERLEQDARLADCLAQEKARIDAVLRGMGLTAEADELAVLKRILLKRAIYGVDVQPFAIELTHLSLWIETFVFGTPLSFIEHHVKAGNSLIGTTRGRFYQVLTASGQQANFLEEELECRFRELNELYPVLNSLQDTTAEDVERSKRIFAEQIRPKLDRLNLLLDILNFCDMLAAEGEEAQAARLRKQIVRLGPRLLEGKEAHLAARLEEYRARYGFFNWGVEFPEVFAAADKAGQGFQIIVGNPPWDKTKFSDPDFFSQYRSNYRQLSNSRKRELQSDLLTKAYVRKRYADQQRSALVCNEYYKKMFALNAGAGDGNLFRFFVERNLALLAPGGTLNYVLPTALLTDDGSCLLRREILNRCRLLAFDGFENRRRLFPDVDCRYKFGLLQVEKRCVPEEEQIARCRFMLENPAQLADPSTAFDYGLADVRATSPGHWAFMEVAGGRADLDILTRAYRRFPALSENWLDFRRELDATNDKRIFRERREPGALPLYKGACIWQYDSAYAAPEYWLNPEQFDAHLRDKEIGRLIEDIYPLLAAPAAKTKTRAVLSALGLSRREELGRFVRPDRQYYRLGFRAIASDTNERTLIAAVLPPEIGAQNSLWLSIPKKYTLEQKKAEVREIPVPRLFFAQALFNSICVDWILRFSTAMNVNKTFLVRLPLPQPTDAELADDPVYAELTRNSLLLSCACNPDAFAALLPQWSLGQAQAPATPKQIALLKIRNDALVAGLYGVGRADMAHMLQSFKVLGRKEPGYAATLLHAVEPRTR